MIVGGQLASWDLVEKNVPLHLSALRTIFLEVLHSATAVTARCSSFSATRLLRYLLIRGHGRSLSVVAPTTFILRGEYGRPDKHCSSGSDPDPANHFFESGRSPAPPKLLMKPLKV